MIGKALRMVVLSGKGGTGKTTLAVSLALSLPSAQLVDCDVEEPNAHLFVPIEPEHRESVEVMVPEPIAARCDGCAGLDRPICRAVCEYGAIAVAGGRVLTFPQLCHSCGACTELCHRGALAEGRRPIGVVEWGARDGLSLTTGRLNVGEPSGVRVIRAAKEKIRPGIPAILDAPPGVACSTVEAMRGADVALLVTEPTPFGLHDLELAVELCRKMSIPAGVAVNRCDLGDDGVEDYCRRQCLPVLLRLPFDRAFAEGSAVGRPLVEVRPESKGAFSDLADRLRELAAGGV